MRGPAPNVRNPAASLSGRGSTGGGGAVQLLLERNRRSPNVALRTGSFQLPPAFHERADEKRLDELGDPGRRIVIGPNGPRSSIPSHRLSPPLRGSWNWPSSLAAIGTPTERAQRLRSRDRFCPAPVLSSVGPPPLEHRLAWNARRALAHSSTRRTFNVVGLPGIAHRCGHAPTVSGVVRYRSSPQVPSRAGLHEAARGVLAPVAGDHPNPAPHGLDLRHVTRRNSFTFASGCVQLLAPRSSRRGAWPWWEASCAPPSRPGGRR